MITRLQTPGTKNFDTNSRPGSSPHLGGRVRLRIVLSSRATVWLVLSLGFSIVVPAAWGQAGSVDALIGGNLVNLGGNARHLLARLNSDGSPDSTFVLG